MKFEEFVLKLLKDSTHEDYIDKEAIIEVFSNVRNYLSNENSKEKNKENE